MNNLCLNRWLSRLRVVCNIMPEWWNRQTRLTQNQVSARACGFKSRLGHQKIFFDFYKKKCYNIYTKLRKEVKNMKRKRMAESDK